MSGGIDDDHIRRILRSFPKRALQMLYDNYYHSLVQVSVKYTNDEATSKDIVQEVLIFIWGKRKELLKSHGVPLKAYLVQVTKYKSIDFYRHNESVQKMLGEFGDYMRNDVEFPLETHIIKTESTDALWRVISSFPKRERQCLKLRYEAGLSLDEIAEELHISRKSVERSLTSAKKRLMDLGKGKTGFFLIIFL